MLTRAFAGMIPALILVFTSPCWSQAQGSAPVDWQERQVIEEREGERAQREYQRALEEANKPPAKPVPMMRVVLLTIVFADGWLGGSTPSGYFRHTESCQAAGNQLALMYIEQHHPASAVCAWKMAPKSREKMVRD